MTPFLSVHVHFTTQILMIFGLFLSFLTVFFCCVVYISANFLCSGINFFPGAQSSAWKLQGAQSVELNFSSSQGLTFANKVYVDAIRDSTQIRAPSGQPQQETSFLEHPVYFSICWIYVRMKFRTD